MKKAAAVILMVTVLVSLFYLPVMANRTDYLTGNFYDLTDKNGARHWAYEEMTELIAMGILQGYTEKVYDRNTGRYIEVQTAKPYQEITRAEFAKILYEALNLEPADTKAQFNDQIPSWAETAVTTLYANGIVMGNPDGTFRGGRQISRAEIAAMLVRAVTDEPAANESVAADDIEEQSAEDSEQPANVDDSATADDSAAVEDSAPADEESIFPDVTIGYWAYPSIQKASEMGLITGFPDGRFAPGQGAKRAEVMAMLYRHLMNDKSDVPDNDTLLSQTDEVSSGIESLVNDGSSAGVESLLPYLTGEMAAYMADPETLKMIDAMKQGEFLGYHIASRGQVVNKSSYWAEVVYDSLATFQKDDISVEADMPIHYYLMKTGDEWQVYKESYESEGN